MIVKRFNDKYKDKVDGIMTLTEMRALMYPIEHIASYFGCSRQAVKQWMVKFFGVKYDPRPDRRESVVKGMIDFAKFNSREDFKEAYKGTEYYKKALEEAIVQGIYEQ